VSVFSENGESYLLIRRQRQTIFSILCENAKHFSAYSAKTPNIFLRFQIENFSSDPTLKGIVTGYGSGYFLFDALL